MKHALVIHPIISYYAGGEYLCLNVCEALQEAGFNVTLASDVFEPDQFEKRYGLQGVIEKCQQVRIPTFKSRPGPVQAFQKLYYAKSILHMFRDVDADIVFSTQSSPFVIPQRVFHFVYSSGDAYGYPPAASQLYLHRSGRGPKGAYFTIFRWFGQRFVWKKRPSSDWFFAVGEGVLSDLRGEGFVNSSFAFPPCRTSFKPRFPKRPRIVQAARIIPDKKLETFLDIATRLPELEFVLLGRNDPMLRALYRDYSSTIFSHLPSNVTYTESLVSECPDLLEESMVYLYTGNERGIGLALVEAIGAGCFPLCPPSVGATDILNALQVGSVYTSAEDAAGKIRQFVNRGPTEEEVVQISQSAEKLSPEKFKGWVKRVVNVASENATGRFEPPLFEVPVR